MNFSRYVLHSKCIFIGYDGSNTMFFEFSVCGTGVIFEVPYFRGETTLKDRFSNMSSS